MAPDPQTPNHRSAGASSDVLRVGAIASLKRGLEHFIDRELRLLEQNGCRIDLFPTKHRRGLYNPQPSWRLHRWSVLAVLLAQPLRLIAAPRAYLAALAEAVSVGAVGDFFLAAYFAPAMRNVDVLYATFGDRKLYVGYFAKRMLGKPLVVEIHAYELYNNPNPRLFGRALAACDRVVSVSQYNRELLQQRFGVDENKVEVVRLSVDLDSYRSRDKFIVLVVAYFVEKKGHEVLLEALSLLDSQDIELWLVGGPRDSSDSVDVASLVEKHGVASQVAFFGEQNGVALRALYQACDVFCLPSRHDSQGEAEGFPSVLIEAMASGKPVVTTRHVEIPRVVPQVLVPENDATALAAALDHVRQLPREDLLAMGRQNTVLAERHFSSTNARRTAEAGERLAGNRSEER
ncbi:MAG: glycosyltransferase family 4 protein, partial [Planctomycetales bacterium]|nr:glycosyltransferase family 4 protein [Planctomycetales bacterium]